MEKKTFAQSEIERLKNTIVRLQNERDEHVSIEDLKAYGFNDINQYFDYIIGSIINGQYSQAKELIGDLHTSQRIEAMDYFRHVTSKPVEYAIKLIKEQ